MRAALTASEIEAGAPTGWSVVDGKLTLVRELPSFLEAVAFVQQVAFLAEEQDHHPDIDVRWRTVRLAVNTHDAGGAITSADLRLAVAVSAL